MDKLYYIHFTDNRMCPMWVKRNEGFSEKLNRTVCKKNQLKISKIEFIEERLLIDRDVHKSIFSLEFSLN